MNPMRNWLFRFCNGAGGAAVEGVTGVEAGRREASRRVAKFRILARSGRSDDDCRKGKNSKEAAKRFERATRAFNIPVYILMVHVDCKGVHVMRLGWKRRTVRAYLNATIICPFEETGFAFSRYAVKLSSRQRTSACVEPGGKEGERGELGVMWEAVATMPHIGQPAFGVKEAIVDDDGERASFPRTLHNRQPLHVTSFLMANASNIVTVFDNFRAEIDDHNDRRERLIKVSCVIVLIFDLSSD